jgi:hypothetical protein
MDLKWLIFLIKPLYLFSMWFGEDQKRKHNKDTCLEEIGPQLQISIIALPSIVNTYNWEDLRIQIKIQQTHTSGAHN